MKPEKMKIGIMAVAFLLSLTSSCSKQSKGPPEKPSKGPELGQVGNILLTKSSQLVGGAKVIVVSFTFTAQGVQSGPVVVSFGSPTIPSFATGDYQMELATASGEKLVSYAIPDPRVTVVEHQGIVMESSVVYAARFPFHANAASVRVRDLQGKQLAEASIAGVIKEFCGRLKDDPDCPAPQQPLRK
jgi:hypothetical protein